jgi:beta-glucosidase
LDANVTSDEHNKIARDLAAKGTVLLKNDANVLPLGASSSIHIAVIGSEALNPTVHGGGSGQVVSYYVSSPLDAIREKLGVTTGDKNSTTTNCDASGKRCVTYAYSSKDAAKIAANADVAIVFGMTTSSEGGDRGDLNLNNDANDLISSVAGVNKRTIAVAVTPGALLTPWSDEVAAVIVSFMPGQEYGTFLMSVELLSLSLNHTPHQSQPLTGHAVADILFGDVNPSARLPITFPNTENEMNLTDSQWPGVNLVSTYNEGLLVGYRYYAAKQITPKFCFGHGLSYTKFEYDTLEITSDAVMFDVKNVGHVDGSTVPQMYFGFPESSGEPPLQLKGFQKIFLKAGESSRVTFNVTQRTVSIWNTKIHDWGVVKGSHHVYVGESSLDIRLSGSYTA